jgi:hypothetical protein
MTIRSLTADRIRCLQPRPGQDISCTCPRTPISVSETTRPRRAHNLQYLAAPDCMQGRFADARQAAEEVVVHISPMVSTNQAMAEPYVPTLIYVLLRFHRWDEILKLCPRDSHLAMTTAVWHLARGSAAAATGHLEMAERECKTLQAARKEMLPDAEFSMYSNKARTFMDPAANILDARIAAAHSDRARAVEYWKHAVQIEDSLYYREPPEWFYPVRESLGAALMLIGQPAQAESVFRADLEQYPRNPRSRFGVF